jgi:COP9 signalosome complex subunit 6
MSASIFLHPLAILNIADQYSRAFFQQSNSRLVGVLVGLQSGRRIEIFSSLELAYNNDTNLIDEKTLSGQQEYCTKVLPAYKAKAMYEVVGWYSISKDLKPAKSDQNIHKQIMALNENPLYMIINIIDSVAHLHDMPIVIYEGGMQVMNKLSEFSFTSLPFAMESDEIERIAVYEVYKSHDDSSKISVYAKHMMQVSNAMEILKQKLNDVISLLEKDPSILKDNKLSRKLKSIIDRMNQMAENSLPEVIKDEVSDFKLLSEIGLMAKSLVALNEMVKIH